LCQKIALPHDAGLCDEMLRHIKAQLAEGEGHPALGMAKEAYLSCNEPIADFEHLMLAWAFVGYEYLKMIIEVFETSLETLLANGRFIRMPIAGLLRLTTLAEVKQGHWRTRMPVSYSTILLVGLTLSEEDVSDSWPNFEGTTNCRAPPRLILAKA